MLALLLVNASAKTKASLSVGFKWSVVGLLLERYVFADWEFAGYLCVIVALDTVSGLLLAIIKRQLSSRSFGQLFTKVAVYTMMLILGHVLTNYKVNGQPNVAFQWFAGLLDAGMMAREAFSILENVAGIRSDLVPSWLLQRMRSFNPLDSSPIPPTV